MSGASGASRVRDVVITAMVVCASSCSSSVQDLGRNAPGESPSEVKDDPSGHEGFGAEWACPDSPLQRDLACPLTRPIEGDACGSRNSAPCAYALDDTSTFCICTRDLRWSCLLDVTMRTLATPFADGELCEGPLTVDMPGNKCSCESGRMRCSP